MRRWGSFIGGACLERLKLGICSKMENRFEINSSKLELILCLKFIMINLFCYVFYKFTLIESCRNKKSTYLSGTGEKLRDRGWYPTLTAVTKDVMIPQLMNRLELRYWLHGSS